MTGFVVPWCRDCGLEAHASVLFDGLGNLLFDDEALDLKIIASQLRRDFTTDQICEHFGYAYAPGRQMIHRLLATGAISEPIRVRGVASIWSAEQVARIIYYHQIKPPIADRDAEPDCGTPAAYRRHIRRHEAIDDACRAAGTSVRSAHRRRERVGAT